MNWMDRFRPDRRAPESRELPPDHEVKGWTVRHTPAHGDGGWRKIEGWELLDEPVSKTEFEINTGPLDPGKYTLFWIQADTERLQTPPEAVAWKLEVETEADVDGPPMELDPEDAAERGAKKALAALQQDGELTPEERVARQKAIIQLALLNNGEFVAKHGEAIALSEFDINESSDGLDFSEYQTNPIGAFLYDTYKDPTQMRELGSHLGAGGGAFFEGLVSGVEEPQSVFEEEIEQAEREAEAAREQAREKPFVSSGPSSLDDLVDRVDDDLADELAATTVDAPDEADEPAGTPGAEASQAGEMGSHGPGGGVSPAGDDADEKRPGSAATGPETDADSDADEMKLDEVGPGPPPGAVEGGGDNHVEGDRGSELTREDIKEAMEEL